MKANPTGVVGMASAMRGDIERAVIFNEELKPLSKFIGITRRSTSTPLVSRQRFLGMEVVPDGAPGEMNNFARSLFLGSKFA